MNGLVLCAIPLLAMIRPLIEVERQCGACDVGDYPTPTFAERKNEPTASKK